MVLIKANYGNRMVLFDGLLLFDRQPEKFDRYARRRHGRYKINILNKIYNKNRFKSIWQGLGNDYYSLNGEGRYQDDSPLGKFRDIINDYEESTDTNFMYSVEQFNTQNHRLVRILVGYEIESWLNRLKEDNINTLIYENRSREDILKLVITNLNLFPGEYDEETYEQLKPDYYHILSQLK